MLCFCGAEIYDPNLIILITDDLNHCHQKVYVVEYESNFITYYISQQINRFNPSKSSRHLAKRYEYVILELLKLVLNRMDLENMLDTKSCAFLTPFK